MLKFAAGFATGVYVSKEYPTSTSSFDNVVRDLRPAIEAAKHIVDNALSGKYSSVTSNNDKSIDSNNRPKPPLS